VQVITRTVRQSQLMKIVARCEMLQRFCKCKLSHHKLWQYDVTKMVILWVWEVTKT